MSPRTAEERRKIAGGGVAVGALALVAAGVIAVFPGKGDVKKGQDAGPPPLVDVVSQPAPDAVAQPHPDMTICYHRETGVVIVALPYGHQWGPGENREPLATADVDLPPGFKAQDLALKRWEYRNGAMVRVPGVKPAVVIVPPDPEAIE